MGAATPSCRARWRACGRNWRLCVRRRTTKRTAHVVRRPEPSVTVLFHTGAHGGFDYLIFLTVLSRRQPPSAKRALRGTILSVTPHIRAVSAGVAGGCGLTIRATGVFE